MHCPQDPALRHVELIQAARTDPAAMASLVKTYRRFMVHIMRELFPGRKRVPIDAYLGEMTITLMKCVQSWRPESQFTTYLGVALRRAINAQRVVERHGRLIPFGCEHLLAPASWWDGLRTSRSDRHWNHRDHFSRARDDAHDHWPEWVDESRLHSWIEQLHGRYREVILRRMAGQTLNEIARSYNVTRERVRQLEQKAISKLKKRAWFVAHNKELRALGLKEVPEPSDAPILAEVA